MLQMVHSYDMHGNGWYKYPHSLMKQSFTLLTKYCITMEYPIYREVFKIFLGGCRCLAGNFDDHPIAKTPIIKSATHIKTKYSVSVTEQ